jgi:cyclase
MLVPRIIPCLLIKNNGLVKTIKFRNERYVGDPLNAIKIFNEKGVDELIFLDISVTREGTRPSFDDIARITSQCFMPICYGGGIRNKEDIRTIFSLGVEKVSLGSIAVENPDFIREVSDIFGSQSIVVCLDVKKNILKQYEVVIKNGSKKTGLDPVKFALKMESLGCGELLVNSVDRDGTMQGYDLDLIKRIAKEVSIPLIACGGAGNLTHMSEVIKQGASSASAGSLFVFFGKRKAVLINYPEREEIDRLFQ